MGKKIIAFTLAAMLILSFAGCGEKADDNLSSEVSSLGSSASATESKAKSDNSGEITLDDVLNHETSPESDFHFSEDGEGNSGVLSYSGSDSIVVIPETYEGMPVTKIETGAFLVALP